MTVDREALAALGYRVIDGKNDVVQSGWLAIPPGKPPTVGIGATEDDAWEWAARHAKQRPYPELLDDDESRAILKLAEDLWADLQTNNLGGFSGINRPFWILAHFKQVIEKFGHRDVGLNWSKNQLDAHPDKPA